jgi:hypothetical protein
MTEILQSSNAEIVEQELGGFRSSFLGGDAELFDAGPQPTAARDRPPAG